MKTTVDTHGMSIPPTRPGSEYVLIRPRRWGGTQRLDGAGGSRFAPVPATGTLRDAVRDARAQGAALLVVDGRLYSVAAETPDDAVFGTMAALAAEEDGR